MQKKLRRNEQEQQNIKNETEGKWKYYNIEQDM